MEYRVTTTKVERPDCIRNNFVSITSSPTPPSCPVSLRTTTACDFGCFRATPSVRRTKKRIQMPGFPTPEILPCSTDAKATCAQREEQPSHGKIQKYLQGPFPSASSPCHRRTEVAASLRSRTGNGDAPALGIHGLLLDGAAAFEPDAAAQVHPSSLTGRQGTVGTRAVGRRARDGRAAASLGAVAAVTRDAVGGCSRPLRAGSAIDRRDGRGALVAWH
jgi:hypothetical protein